MKVFIVEGYGYGQLFTSFGHEVTVDMLEADLVCFTGGEDVSPHLYGEKKHPATFNCQVRDTKEKAIFNICLEKGIPMVGICRGGQFLNVMSGGKMYQHVSKHTQDHAIKDLESGKRVFASSTHHQMMRSGPGGEVVAVANQGGFKQYMKGEEVCNDSTSLDDTEVVFYSLTKCLCFQPHPEFLGKDLYPLKEYFFELISRYLVKE